MTPYQPVIRGGEIVAAGERDCDDRYDAIQDVLNSIGFPFTMLDLGANTGYFSIRATQDFACHVTAIDSLPALKDARSDRINVIDIRVSARELHQLRRNDITLALSVLHHMRDWRDVLKDLQACRIASIIEVCHPDERWMKSAAARHEVRQIHNEVATRATKQIGSFPRIGRDGKTYMRPMYILPGRVKTYRGHVFSGSGSCSKRLPEFGRGLEKHLDYTPFPGSLNLRTTERVKLGKPIVNWIGCNANRKRRDYQFWSAWIDDLPCHAMVPGRRGWGLDSLEMVAPMNLRNLIGLSDGDMITVDVEIGR